jgi:hypothetical protein
VEHESIRREGMNLQFGNAKGGPFSFVFYEERLGAADFASLKKLAGNNTIGRQDQG